MVSIGNINPLFVRADPRPRGRSRHQTAVKADRERDVVVDSRLMDDVLQETVAVGIEPGVDRAQKTPHVL